MKAAWAVPGAGAEPEAGAELQVLPGAELQVLPEAEVQQQELPLQVLLRERVGVQAGERAEPEQREFRKTCHIRRRKQRHRDFPYRN